MHCRRHLVQVAEEYPKLVQLDTEVIAVGPNNREAFASFFAKHRIPYPGIPDPDEAILASFGQVKSLWRFGRLPAQFLIDKEGIIRFVEYGKSAWDQTPPGELGKMAMRMTGVSDDEADRPHPKHGLF